jgi:bacteriorhodopsin
MLYESGLISLSAQILIGVIDFWGLTIDIPEDKNLLKDLLKLELSVQVLEFIFYVWMIYNFSNISNITPYRYYDWFFTTPMMLITLMAFLSQDKYNSLSNFIKNEKKTVIHVIAANLLMLLFGLMSEHNVITYTNGILLGFVPFVYYYNKIYNKYITKDSTKEQKGLFWFFFIIWSLYGVAALYPYDTKNTMYNILDIFAKNLFGLILVYFIWNNRKNALLL